MKSKKQTKEGKGQYKETEFNDEIVPEIEESVITDEDVMRVLGYNEWSDEMIDE